MKNLGPVQIRIIARATGAHMVMPANFLERRACRRLEARGILVPALTYPDCWRL